MRRATRNVEIGELRDLLSRPGRGALGSVHGDKPVVVPARLHWTDERWRAGVDPSHGRPPAAGDEVVLVVDEGQQFFDLRAAFVRGRATPVESPSRATDGLMWFEITPSVVVGWDYGRMRYADDDRVARIDRRPRGEDPDGGG